MTRRPQPNPDYSLKIPGPKGSDEDLILETTIPYQINRLAHHMNRLLEDELAQFGLSITKWRILAVLDFNSSATVNQLADYAMVEQSTLSRMLSRMERDGDIENRLAETDRRVRNIVLTKQGKRKYKLVRGLTLTHVSRIVDGFSRKDQDKLLELIQHMQANVAAHELAK